MTRTPSPASITVLAVLTAFALVLFAPGSAPPARAAVEPATAADEADSLHARFDDEGAIASCRAALAADSTSYDLWWRLARSLTNRGTRAGFDGDKEKAEAAYVEAVTAGRRAVVLGSDRPEGHLELAVALGRLALFRGGKEKIRLSKEIKSEVDQVLVLDPRQHRAEHVLGRWNRGIAELNFFEKAAANTILGGLPKDASMDNAVTHFERAIALEPDYANHHLELGRTLLKLGLKAKARAEFEKALACPQKSAFDSEYKKEAQQLMAKTS